MPMNNSRMPEAWVRDMVAANPFTKQAGGNFTTCPVRLAFTHVVKPNPNAKNDDGTPKAKPSYEVTALLPTEANEQIDRILWPEVYAMLKQGFPGNFNAQGAPFGLHIPWRDQAEKQQFAGYTPGNKFLRFTTEYKPAIVDSAMNPIVNDDRVYAGCWAILNFNMFEFGRSPPRPKKGVSLGLNTVMLIGDDDKLAGGAVSPQEAFASVRVTAQYDVGAAMAAAGGGAPPPSSIMPAPTNVGTPPPPPAPGQDQTYNVDDMLS